MRGAYGHGKGRKGGGRHMPMRQFQTPRPSSPHQVDLRKIWAGDVATIRDEASASLFFRAVCQGPEPMIMLWDLSAENGKKAVKRAASLCSSTVTGIKALVEFLAFLGKDELNHGSSKDAVSEIYHDVYHTPGLMKCLLARVTEKAIENLTAVVWFLVSVALYDAEARSNADVQRVCEEIQQSENCPAISRLVTVLASRSTAMAGFASLDDVYALQPKHNNDFPTDYRKTSIVPTADEINCLERTPIPPTITEDVPQVEIEARMLDRQFRLLREDMLAPMKEELTAELKLKHETRRRLFANPILMDISCVKNRLSLLIRVDTPPRLRSRLHQCSGKKEREDYVANFAKRILGKDSLVLFLDNQGKVRFVGVINRREPQEMVLDAKYLMVGIMMVDEGLEDFLALQHRHRRDNNDYPCYCGSFLYQASVSFFSYQPVLEQLKHMSTVPFAKQLAFMLGPDAKDDVEASEDLSSLLAPLGEDASQLSAARSAINNNVSLIQGPPGTGKTFIGVHITKILLHMNPATKVLCICYTNHALDNFLESLLDSGVTSMVRLGHSPKVSERLQGFCLRGSDNNRISFDRAQTVRFARLASEREGAQQSIEHNKSLVFDSRMPGRGTWKYFCQSLSMLSSIEQQEIQELTMTATQGSDGMKLVGAGGKALREDYLFLRWLNGEELPQQFATVERSFGDGSIWRLNTMQRRQKLNDWYQSIRKARNRSMCDAIRRHERAVSSIDNLRQETIVPNIGRAKIIGCTSTSAAKLMDFIDAAAPDVLVIEEAAEILEANVLTSIPPSIQRVILIGDHLQLRPKLEYYPLRKESEQGIDFDVSVFERLIRQSHSFPFSTLNVQHRMRPEISMLVRQTTYPTLQDHASVLNRPHIRGIASDVVFIDHREEESENEERAVLGMGSKSNAYEAAMTAKIVKYLLQQGYAPNEIVVLTPYLGQLLEIQNALRNVNETVFIGHMDKNDINRASIDPNEKSSAKAEPAGNGNPANRVADTDKSSGIRVATIDNYQGEESKIIVGSLVRSNSDNDIGFVSGAERVNVFLSRARDGFIMIGNLNCLRNSRSRKGKTVWGKVYDALHASGRIFDGFPAVCQCHGQRVTLRNPSEFDILTPLGGCDRICDQQLKTCPLGHRCLRPCHPIMIDGTDVHLTMPCEYKLSILCPYGHQTMRFCHKSDAEPCSEIVLDKCQFGHIIQRKCFQSHHDVRCSTCKRLADKKRQLEEESRKQAMECAERLEQLECERAVAEAKLMEELLKREQRIKCRQAEQEATAMAKRTESLRREMEIDEQQEVIMESVIEQPLNLVENEVKMDIVNEPLLGGEELLATADMLDYDPHCSVAEKKQMKAVDECGTLTSCSSAALGTHLYCPPRQEEEKSASMPVRLKTSKDLTRWLNDADAEEWIRLYEACCAYVKCERSDTILKLAARALAALAQFKLGINPQSVLLELYAILKEAAPVGKRDCWDSRVVKAILSFVQAIVEAADDRLRHSAAEHARQYSSLYELFCNEYKHGYFRRMLDEAKFIQHAAVNCHLKDPDSQLLSDSSKSAHAWKQKKATSSTAAHMSSVDNLMKMIGLESVKEAFLRQYDKILISKEQNVPLSSASYNARFDGNPGTGKTTVARLYAQFLIDMEVLPHGSVIEETSGSTLASGAGVNHLKTKLEKLKEVGGGVIFIDEAYQLNPDNDREGRQVLDFLLVHAEKLEGQYGRVVWVFAGYKALMDKLFEHNPGLPSRFPIKLMFDDYSDEELYRIFTSLMDWGGIDNDIQPNTSNASNSENEKAKVGKRTVPISSNGRNDVSKDDERDEWKNLWRWNSSMCYFEDDYNNITAIGARNLGSADNPLICLTDNSAWYYHRSKQKWFTSESPLRWSDYPGKPAVAEKKLSPKPFTVSDMKWVRIAIRRLSKARGKVGFGNARAVRNLFDQTRQRQAARLSQQRSLGYNPDIMQFERSDLLGPKPTIESLESTKAWKELQALEGLMEVKQELRKMFDVMILNAEREESELPVLEVSLNRVFLGNPGTGKTTVGKLYAQILASMGLLSKGECIVKNPSDFVGSALGTSESITRGILAQAEGCVLVIDEAYLLNPSMGSTSGSTHDPYKSAVIDTIVEQVQGVPGDDRAVVLLGYRKEMEALMAAANPGLSRRFQMENALVFADYDDNSLIRILIKLCQKDQLVIDLDVARLAVKKLGKARALPNFGNAGALNNLFSEAKKSFLSRQRSRSLQRPDNNVLVISDFGGVNDSGVSEDDLLAGLVGCKQIVSKLEEYRSLLKLCQERGEDPKKYIEFNFIFAGPPGTGKTTIARRMGTMFYSLGLLPCADVLEMSASDLITGFVGQAGKKTLDIMTKARGKVLFIDEAYRLNPQKGGPYMQEVVDELVQQLTSAEFKQQLVVILAGYAEDMNTLLSVNEGLRSRFSERLDFPPFSAEEVVEMFTRRIHDSNLGELSPSCVEQASSYAEQLVKLSSFDNGRDIDTLAKRVIRSYATKRVGRRSADEITIADLRHVFEPFIEEKRASASSEKTEKQDKAVKASHSGLAHDFQSQSAVLPTTAIKVNKQESSAPEKEEWEVLSPLESDAQRFNKALQAYLDERGLNSLEGIKSLTSYAADSKAMKQLLERLVQLSDLDVEELRRLLSEWKHDVGKLEEKLREVEREKQVAKAQKRKALLPIWRCAVCGRADKPYIACYVRPFVVRYEEVEANVAS